MGTFDRIVDGMGASHYTKDLTGIFESYGRLLKPGGLVFAHVDTEKIDTLEGDSDRSSLSLPPAKWVGKKWGGPRTSIRTNSGRLVNWETWLRAMKGFELEAFERDGRGLAHVVLRRTTAPLVIPELKARRIVPGRPLYREFVLSKGDRSCPRPKW